MSKPVNASKSSRSDDPDSGALPQPRGVRLRGTKHHPEARDLSEYLVHMTKTEEDLRSILSSGSLEGRNAFGIAPYWAKHHDEVKKRHLSVCLTEMPLSELARMGLAQTNRPYGLVFRQDFIRKMEGQPVWYVGENSEACIALRALCEDAVRREDWSNSIWKLTPYIDKVQSPDQGPYDFQYEREWRVLDGFRFTPSDVLMIVNVSATPLANRELLLWYGGLVYDSLAREYRWVGSSAEPTEESLELMKSIFLGEYARIDEFYWDGREGGYQTLGTSILDTEDAILALFDDIPDESLQHLVDEIDGICDRWFRWQDEIDDDYHPEDDPSRQ